MKRIILESIIHLIIVLPIILLTLKDKNPETFKILLAFSIYFIMHNILLYLPIEYNDLRIINGNWNWVGKFFAILGSISFLLFYKKFELKDYYLTLKQNKSFLKKGILIISIILLIKSIWTFSGDSPKDWNIETIIFQLTMPGLDEEIAYRGIMLGILAKILKPRFKATFLHPAILITGILFGFAHGLFITESYELSFRSFQFINTLVSGMIWGWITMKSGSILLALISHNLENVTNKIIRMR